MQDISDLLRTSEKKVLALYAKNTFFIPPFAASFESKANSFITLTLLHNDLY